ncbi:hypothetical protein LTR36_008523 [Oleoguttula mirabilis]|uniref:Uncharacterized protein n=1 Tax=Oleoguttula mirabilis TaxID=1507867 RepID=A0AAV9JT68_9PEZI|nr:hypothetical protein LTR36_008523 [Oleoguttula mirabilis]
MYGVYMYGVDGEKAQDECCRSATLDLSLPREAFLASSSAAAAEARAWAPRSTTEASTGVMDMRRFEVCSNADDVCRQITARALESATQAIQWEGGVPQVTEADLVRVSTAMCTDNKGK